MKKSLGLLHIFSTFIAIVIISLLLFGCSKSGGQRQTNAKDRPSDSSGSGASDRDKQGEQAQADKEKNQAPEESAAEKQPPATTASSENENDAAEESMEKPRNLGPPLVNKPEELIKLPDYPVWIDKKNKQVVLVVPYAGPIIRWSFWRHIPTAPTSRSW